METLPIASTILWVFVGIIISIILPIAVKYLQKGFEANQTFWGKIKNLWEKYSGSKYFLVFLSAVVVAVILVFLLDLKFYSIRDATLAGFAWESLVTKLVNQGD